ncbi:hypothetical protein ABZT26_03030 [Streptomyces sp. NPDC005395]|uniref:hypothetical protein n=1 Tax=unclassified Streptomyces TaxID=2593676 RepID=UPI001F2B80B4|nr:hypothetical protein [Streptomyces sp. BSE6.1]
MTELICLRCPNYRRVGHYLCLDCWNALPADARHALNRRDRHAFARLRQLHAQLRDGVPLNRIEVHR